MNVKGGNAYVRLCDIPCVDLCGGEEGVEVHCLAPRGGERVKVGRRVCMDVSY